MKELEPERWRTFNTTKLESLAQHCAVVTARFSGALSATMTRIRTKVYEALRFTSDIGRSKVSPRLA